MNETTEPSKSEVSPLRRWAPLPWLLLGVTIVTGLAMVAMGKHRIDDERLRTATALKASDEVLSRLREAGAENERLAKELAAKEQLRAEAEAKAKRLTEQMQTNADELAKLKSNPRCARR